MNPPRTRGGLTALLAGVLRHVGRMVVRQLGYTQHRIGRGIVMVPATAHPRSHVLEVGVHFLETRLMELINQHGITQVLDAGANAGQFALRLRELGYVGDIISFEPNPVLAGALRSRAADADHWFVQELALGVVDGEATLLISEASDMASLHPATAKAREIMGVDAMEIQRRVTVPVRSLESWLAEHPTFTGSLGQTLLKIDTQGHDMEVIRGAGGRLADIPLVLLELSQVPLYESVPSLHEVLGELWSLNLRAAAITPVCIDEATGAVIEFDGLFVHGSERD